MAVFRRVPGRQEGKKGPVGATVRPRLAEKEKHMSSQPGVPTSPSGPGPQPASPRLGLQGLLLAPHLVPRGWGIDISHRRRRHLCHGLLGSGLLVGGPSLCLPPFGPAVLEPNLNPSGEARPVEAGHQAEEGRRTQSRAPGPCARPSRLTSQLPACGGAASPRQTPANAVLPGLRPRTHAGPEIGAGARPAFSQ